MYIIALGFEQYYFQNETSFIVLAVGTTFQTAVKIRDYVLCCSTLAPVGVRHKLFQSIFRTAFTQFVLSWK